MNHCLVRYGFGWERRHRAAAAALARQLLQETNDEYDGTAEATRSAIGREARSLSGN